MSGWQYEQTTPSIYEDGNGWVDINIGTQQPRIGDTIDVWVQSTMVGASIGKRIANHRWCGATRFGPAGRITHYRYQPAPPVAIIDSDTARRAGK
ncbi:hypothetical protein N9164_12595 [Draconibacterium sp.]|nr:hypothetical protein [Draconibacterium sp.]